MSDSNVLHRPGAFPPSPYSNTGVTLGTASPSISSPAGVGSSGLSQKVAFCEDKTGGVLCRFDYYRVSVSEDLDRVLDLIRRAVGSDRVSGRPMFGYERGFNFLKDGAIVASVFHSCNKRPLVQASGAFAQLVYMALQVIPRDRIALARGDICVDSVSGDFEIIDSVIRDLALARGVCTSVRGDWDTPGSPAGRTRYVGARESFRFRRLYEYFKCHGVGAAWRYELEVKPTSSFKDSYGAMCPAEILRADDFSRKVLFSFGVDLTRLVVSVPSAESYRDPFANMVRQYHKILTAALAERGGDVARLGADLMACVDAVRQYQRKQAG